MAKSRHKVFISYHHSNDQYYKNKLLELNSRDKIFIDCSVDIGDIDEGLGDQTIRQKIRDEYLRDSTVTLLLVGKETKYRKHIDWELYSSMYDGSVNKKSGILVVILPNVESCICATHGEKEYYQHVNDWVSYKNRSDLERAYPSLSPRIIDNLLDKDIRISITNWNVILNDSSFLRKFIDETYKYRKYNPYDLSREMKRKNS